MPLEKVNQKIKNYKELIGKDFEENQNIMTTVKNPKILSIVHHTGWRKEHDNNYPCDVLIVDGEFQINGQISNYWRWKRVLEDGSLSEVESGYGSFVESTSDYNIEIIVTKKQ